MIEVKDDVFPHATDFRDAAMLEDRRDLRGWGFQRLLLLPEPHGFDNVPGDAFGEAAGYGFDFGEFGHGDRRS
jgi:hypothetical protein